MILDTSFVIDVLRNKPYAITIIKHLEKISILKISTISVFELTMYLGVDKSIDILANFQIIPVSEEIATLAGKIAKTLIKKGKQIDNEDCLIAATTLLENEQLVTLNIKHFARIEKLKLLDL